MDSAEADFRPLPPQDYPKLSQSYYSLLEVLTQDHMNFIASLEPHVIMYRTKRASCRQAITPVLYGLSA